MNNKRKLISLAFLTMMTTAPVCLAEGLTGNVSMFLGQKYLDDSDWSDVGDMSSAAGMMSDFRMSNWPVSIAVDLIGSEKEKSSATQKTNVRIRELDLGAKKIWDLSGSSISPYLGGGVAIVNARREFSSIGISPATSSKDDETTTGLWLTTGTYWNVTDWATLGANVRYTYAEVDLGNDKNLDAGGFMAGITAGVRF